VTPERPAQAQRRRATRGSAHPRDRLRHLAEIDEGITRPAHDTARQVDPHGLDERTAALARLAALVALRAAPASYQRCVDLALAAGASVDEVLDTLKVVAPTVGLVRVVSAAPEMALALGYDIDSALESLDDPRAGDTRVPGGDGPTA
jgi:4-carboxymuconolactone decarboxylase